MIEFVLQGIAACIGTAAYAALLDLRAGSFIPSVFLLCPLRWHHFLQRQLLHFLRESLPYFVRCLPT